MNSKPSVIPYILKELADSFFGFFSDWYLYAPKIFWKKTKGSFKSWERNLALQITVRNWLTPLYQDYSPTGYLVGITTRTLRIIFGLIFYFFFFLFAFLAILSWLLFPPFLAAMVIINLFS